MAKPIKIKLTIQLPAGSATAAPPVGTALGPHGINIGDFVKRYNEATAKMKGDIVPVEVTIYEDRSFDFKLKTPPASDLLRKASGLQWNNCGFHETSTMNIGVVFCFLT